MISRLPLGQIRLLTALGGGRQDDRRWHNASRRYRVFYDKRLGAHISVDLADWGGRWYYYPARYYDSFNHVLIERVLDAGDAFIDIGANVGIHTLKGSSRVGVSGKVLAIEPNPETFQTLQLHTALNHRKNVITKNAGAGETASVMRIHGDQLHSGTYSLVNHGHGQHQIEVKVERTSDLIEEDLLRRRRVLIKIDVEGFELKVLRGMLQVLERPNIVVSLEVTPEWMALVGDSVDQLEELVARLGYRVLHPTLMRHPFRGREYSFRTGPIDRRNQTDVVLVSQSSAAFLGDYGQGEM
ncbi:FkbM family methyltransferase [Paludibaculum fermentans]|uniref:FkbM family methyltransferase n=1 Tax=Paludibaculum fermentans TaxID=1473598 RepID=UPI003EBB5E79